jgi:hypothetical protein
MKSFFFFSHTQILVAINFNITVHEQHREQPKQSTQELILIVKKKKKKPITYVKQNSIIAILNLFTYLY